MALSYAAIRRDSVFLLRFPFLGQVRGFHWSLTVCKFPQVSKTHLSNMDNHNYAIIWVVSTCLDIPMSSSPFINSMVTVPSALIRNWFHCHLHIPEFFFSSLARSKFLYLFRLPSVLPCNQLEQQSLLFGCFSFFFFFSLLFFVYYLVWSSDGH